MVLDFVKEALADYEEPIEHLTCRCLLDLNNRLTELENKFNIKEKDWELWHNLKKQGGQNV